RICCRSVARIAPFSIGTSKRRPLRLSMTVRLSFAILPPGGGRDPAHPAPRPLVVGSASKPPRARPRAVTGCSSGTGCYEWHLMRRFAGFLLLVAALRSAPGGAVQLDALDPAREWKIRSVRFRGIHAVHKGDLVKVMANKPRPWFALWR